jgi:formylglycine-generating enzyme required for sulfatase activity
MHRVRITRPFYLGVYPVTQQEYERVIGSNPSATTEDGRHPVEQVSWFDAVTFCNKLSERENLPSYYTIAGAEVSIRGRAGYRLLTEAEWEYACRAGSTTRFSSGDDEAALRDYGWFLGNSASSTHPVGERKPNAWGLCDMHGNVFEWCQDWYDAEYYGTSVQEDPPGPSSGVARVVRGGSYLSPALGARSAARTANPPDRKIDYLGFRCALVPTSE